MRVRTFPRLPGPVFVERDVFEDARGHFAECYHEARYASLGIEARFVQVNVSRSRRGVLRGLHFQHPDAQGKLVSVTRGRAFDVAVDIRVGSPTFGEWVGAYLTAAGGEQLYVPPDFAHGFIALGDPVDLLYQCTALYQPKHQHTLSWSDPRLGIEWPLSDPILSEKDARGLTLGQLERRGLLPEYRSADGRVRTRVG